MIIFIYGQDSFRGKKKTAELKKKFLNEIDLLGSSFTTVSGSDLTLDKFNELIAADSLFVKKRMIIVEDVFKHKDKKFLSGLSEYLQEKEKSNDNIIIFTDFSIIKQDRKGVFIVDKLGKEKKLLKDQTLLFNYLNKQPYTQYFGALSGMDLINWVKESCQSAGAKITYQAIQLLISLTGNNLWSLSNEIDKIINYKLGSRVKGDTDPKIMIEVGDVFEMTKGDLDENIFALTDALSNRNKAQAVKILSEQIKAGMADYYLISMLTRQFKILLQVRQCLDMGLTSIQIGNQLKFHPYVLRKAVDQAKNFRLTHLKAIFSTLVKIDYKLKTSKLPVETMLDLLIVKI